MRSDPSREKLVPLPVKEIWQRPQMRKIDAAEAETSTGLATDVLSAHS